MWRRNGGAVAYGLRPIVVGILGSIVRTVNLQNVSTITGELFSLTQYTYRRGEYLQHGIFDTFCFDQPVLLEVVDKGLI